MSRVTRKEWYTRVNGAWPEQLPELTPIEAIRAARRLYRFVKGRTFPAHNVRLTSGRRYTWIRRSVMFVNPNGHENGSRRGWESLVHDLSHCLAQHLNHGGEHARLELRMIKEVIRRGWLDGRLRDKPKVDKPKADPRAVKYARVLASIERWEKKLTRANNALKKLNRQAKRYARIAGSTSTTVH